MVGQSGQILWTGAARIAGARLSAHVSIGPRPGVYWVRLYTSGNRTSQDETSRGELVREFGMRLR